MADRVHMTIDLARFNARIHRYIQASGRDADAAVLQIATEVLADTQESWPVDSGHSRAEWWGPTRIAPASLPDWQPGRVRQGAGVRIVYRRGAKNRSAWRDTTCWSRSRRAWNFFDPSPCATPKSIIEAVSGHREGLTSGRETLLGTLDDAACTRSAKQH